MVVIFAAIIPDLAVLVKALPGGPALLGRAVRDYVGFGLPASH